MAAVGAVDGLGDAILAAIQVDAKNAGTTSEVDGLLESYSIIGLGIAEGTEPLWIDFADTSGPGDKALSVEDLVEPGHDATIEGEGDIGRNAKDGAVGEVEFDISGDGEVLGEVIGGRGQLDSCRSAAGLLDEPGERAGDGWVGVVGEGSVEGWLQG